ncbi:hypothetical protein D3C71_1369860 [compost metagenome]
MLKFLQSRNRKSAAFVVNPLMTHALIFGKNSGLHNRCGTQTEPNLQKTLNRHATDIYHQQIDDVVEILQFGDVRASAGAKEVDRFRRVFIVSRHDVIGLLHNEAIAREEKQPLYTVLFRALEQPVTV